GLRGRNDGGSLSESAGARSDVDRVHSTGPSVSAAARTRSTRRATSPQSRRRRRETEVAVVIVASLVEDEALAEPELESRDGHDEQHEDHADRGGLAELEALERGLEDHHDGRAGRIAGPASREDVRL